ncbi:MAG: glycosyltransferase [Bacteroidales bacterium]|nr:glycosyltransferase [Bacteroidales bacterium]
MIFDVIDFPEYNSLTAIILYVFAFFSTVQLFYYWFFFRKMAFYKPKKQLEFYPKVSVVICAHNEYQNIKEFLPLVLEQDYPHFEVILVNDDSDDNSEFLMIDFKAKYPHFKIVNTNRSVTFIRGKKFPLSVGIKTAIHPIVLLTDADCYPASKNWIKEMVAGYQNENIEFSLGYGRYEKRKGFLNLLVRFDTVHTALQYFSAA